MDLDEELGLEWSFRPIVVWLKIIGIDLNLSSSSRKTCISNYYIYYGLICLLFDTCFSALAFRISNLEWGNDRNSLVFVYTFRIDFIVSILQGSLPHLLLLWYCKKYCNVTGNFLRIIESEFKFRPSELLRMRRMSFMAVYNVIIMVRIVKEY